MSRLSYGWGIKIGVECCLCIENNWKHWLKLCHFHDGKSQISITSFGKILEVTKKKDLSILYNFLIWYPSYQILLNIRFIIIQQSYMSATYFMKREIILKATSSNGGSKTIWSPRKITLVQYLSNTTLCWVILFTRTSIYVKIKTLIKCKHWYYHILSGVFSKIG